MRAAVLRGHGGPEQLVVTEVADPLPGPGQVRVAVGASSVNNTDLWTRAGAYGSADDPDSLVGWRGVPVDVPRIQGGDVVGVVDEVGAGVDPTLVGRRVLVDPALYDDAGPDATPVGLLGSERDGGFAGYTVADAERVHDVTHSPLPDEQLAALPVAYGTAMGMLDRAGVVAGHQVLVTGASGGVGLAAVQLADRLGARVVALTTAATADAVVDAGADAVIDRRGDVPAQCAEVLDGPLHAVLDVVGGPLFSHWAGLLAVHGTIVVAGAVAGARVEVDLRRLYLDQRRIVGSSMHTPRQFLRLVQLAHDEHLDVPVAAVHGLDDVHGAQARFTAEGTVGKVVIRIGADDR